MPSVSDSILRPQDGEIRLLSLAVPVELARTEVPPRTLERILTAEERERYRALRIPERRAGLLLSRVLLRALLASDLPGGGTAVALAREEWGKPYLVRAGRRLPVHLNNSDTPGCLLWAFGRAGPLGCDVERIGAAEEAVADEVFEPGELAAWRALDEADRREHFYRLWTLKEAVLKADGRGLHLPLRSFRIELPASNEGAEPRVTLLDPQRGPSSGPWRLFEFEALSGVRGAAAVVSAEPVRFRVQRLSMERWSVDPDGQWAFAEAGPDRERGFAVWDTAAGR